MFFPVRMRLLAVCAGIALHSRVSAVPEWFEPPGIVLVLVIVGLAVLALFSHLRLSRFTVILSLSLLVLWGFLWAMLLAQIQLAQRLPAQLQGVDFWVFGQIEGLVRKDQDAADYRRSQQFDFRVEFSCFQLLPQQCVEQYRSSAAEHNVLVDQLISLNDYGNLLIYPGQYWQLRVRLNRPHGFSNPGGSDFEAGQFQRGIMARGYIRETSLNRQIEGERKRFLLPQFNSSAVRAGLVSDIDSIRNSEGQPLPNAGLLKALVVGDYGGITGAQWELFRNTGTIHLMVISGLHIGFVAMTMFWLVNRCVRLFPSLLLRVPAQHVAALFAMAAAVFYSVLAGFSLPVQRSLIMIVVLMAARLSGKAIAPGDSLSLAALLVLMKDPMAVVQAGFWLSFIAVAALFLAFTGYRDMSGSSSARAMLGKLWQNWVQPQWAVSAGLLMPLLFWTGQMSLNSPLSNIFAIPVVSLLVVPLALTASLLIAVDVPFGYLPMQAADWLLTWTQAVLIRIENMSPDLWQPATPSVVAMLSTAIGSVLLLLPKGLIPRLVALMFLLPLLWTKPPARPMPGQVWIQFLDVGQGLAIAVHTHQHDLLFDTGPALGSDFDVGRAVILPYLRYRHVQALDMLIVSHWHADHSGGVNTVLAEIPVQERRAGAAGSGSAGSGSAGSGSAVAGFDRCEAGQHWVWDDVRFTIIFPPADVQAIGVNRGQVNINNTSCVLLVEAGGQSALLTGDIEREAEHWLVQHWSEVLAGIDILQAPHHGSRSSSTTAFLQATGPGHVVMSAGYRNRFNHPHDEVLQRYQAVGAQVLQTADSGALLFEMGGSEPRLLSRHREQQRRFWFNL